MPERSERILKIACVVLAALLGFQLYCATFRHNPLEHSKIPALPALAAEDAKGTNSVTAEAAGKGATNGAGTKVSSKAGTNVAAAKMTNQTGSKVGASSKSEEKGTNAVPMAVLANAETNSMSGTNLVAGTNLVSGTNAPAGTNAASTNAMAKAKPGKRAGRVVRQGQGAGKKAVELPPIIEARIEKIKESEILAQVDHPAPMGLLGIAGEYAFLRAANGQTGMVKAGDELGGLKLLRIGVNRVLVEDAGEKKELTIFEGYGSETLLPKANDKPNEIITKTK